MYISILKTKKSFFDLFLTFFWNFFSSPKTHPKIYKYMKKHLKVTPIQTNIIWENIEENLKNLNTILNDLDETDLVILPEMFQTGFTLNTSLSETMEGRTISQMKEWAKTKNISISGSLIIEEEDKFFNRFVLVSPDSTVQHYDKRHLFRFATENKHFTPGENKVIWEVKGWKICPMVCYDLRFPVWSRNKEKYDLLLYTASWPDSRIEIWRTLLRARAIENMAFTIGVNRIGTDGANLNYNGFTSIISPTGETLLEVSQNSHYGTFQLNIDQLRLHRERYPFLLDMDDFQIL